MLPGGRLRITPNITLKLITPTSPSKPQLSGASHISKATSLPRFQDAVPIKIVIPRRKAPHPEPLPYSSSVDNSMSALPQVEKSGGLTETPQVPRPEPNASSTTHLHVIIPPVKPQSDFTDDVDPYYLPDLLYPSDWETCAVSRASTVPLTPPRTNTVSTPVTSPLRAGFAPLPSVQGPFRILRNLPKGGFASACGVEDLSSGRLLCLKVFTKDSPKYHHAEAGILRELEVYKRIATSKETCIGKMFVMELEMSFRAHGDHICFAMELMTNDLLEYMFHDSSYCEANARRWAAQMALGIKALHDMGIIHRDLKSENILIDARGNVRIADFGLSYIDEKSLHPWNVYTSDVTGTIPCMAPEIITNKNRDIPCRRKYGLAVDWWSFGCILYELATPDHKPLFSTIDTIEKYVSWTLQHKPFPAFNKVDPLVRTLIERLLKPSAVWRYGFQDVRKHDWFRNSDGTSEFDDACSNALGRIARPQLLPADLKDATQGLLIPLRAGPCVCLWKCSCSEMDWMNPRSGFASNRRN